MTASNVYVLNEEQCPVSESTLGQLHNSNPSDAAEVASKLPEPQRAQLAAFCYERRHLHHLGLIIASTCGRHALKKAFGLAGDVVFKQSRRPDETVAEELRNTNHSTPKPVTLATFVRPIDDSAD
jgi:hypothetical protein